MSALNVHQSSLAAPPSDLSIRFASWPERLSTIRLVSPLDAFISPRLALSVPVTVAPLESICNFFEPPEINVRLSAPSCPIPVLVSSANVNAGTVLLGAPLCKYHPPALPPLTLP